MDCLHRQLFYPLAACGLSTSLRVKAERGSRALRNNATGTLELSFVDDMLCLHEICPYDSRCVDALDRG